MTATTVVATCAAAAGGGRPDGEARRRRRRRCPRPSGDRPAEPAVLRRTDSEPRSTARERPGRRTSTAARAPALRDPAPAGGRASARPTAGAGRGRGARPDGRRPASPTVSRPDLAAHGPRRGAGPARPAVLGHPARPAAVAAPWPRVEPGHPAARHLRARWPPGGAAQTVSTVALSLLRRLLPAPRPCGAAHLPRPRGDASCVPPTRSVELASRAWATCRPAADPAGRRAWTPSADLVRRERWRDPSRRPLLVVVTDGRATGGSDPVGRARSAARRLAGIVRRGGGRRGGPGPARARRPARVRPRRGARHRRGPRRPRAGRPGWRPPGPWPPSSAPRRSPDAAGTGHVGARRRAHHPPAPRPSRCSSCTPATARASRPPPSAWRCAPGRRAGRSGCSSSPRAPSGRSGEEDGAAGARPPCTRAPAQGGPVTWHKMGEGWSWLRTQPEDHERAAQRGLGAGQADLAAETYRLLILDEFTYPVSNGTLDVDRGPGRCWRRVRARSMSSSPAAGPTPT